MEPIVAAVGVFDGLHKGHQKVLKKAVLEAARLGAKSAVLSFFPHPSKITKTRDVELISNLDARVKLMEDFGIDYVFIKNFDKKFSLKNPEEFFIYLKEAMPNIKGIVTGENFHFGNKALGGADWLKTNAKKYGVRYFCVAGLPYRTRRISSSRLREAVKDGNMAEFERMAGRPYYAEGAVEGGRKLGRELGYPTLNLPYAPECRPPYGVYVAKLYKISKGKLSKPLWGVASYGLNPSIGKIKSPVLETHLFETPDFGEGAQIRVELHQFLRREKKFDSLEALKKQIGEDKEQAQKIAEAAQNARARAESLRQLRTSAKKDKRVFWRE